MSRTTFSRRRFLAVAAAALAGGPAAAQTTTRWQGRALGAEATITLRGPQREAVRALAAAKETLRQMERLFSLYDPGSALSHLNATGRLERPEEAFLALLRLADRIHHATGGLFDPSVQPLWRALARSQGRPDRAMLAQAAARVAWPGVAFDEAEVRFLRPGMALTLNGIAQGFATDRVAEALKAQGFAATLVNIGEFRAGTGSWRIGLADPAFGLVRTRSLSNAAIATSSLTALPFGNGGLGHILNPAEPGHPPLWSTVSVEAATAAYADGYSTALSFFATAAARSLLHSQPELQAILLVDHDGVVIELT
ncbi:FAD:protein FMN transferase [Pelagibius marinus]|uniref:FAD:protein FMN transferase n=1 Tax=Pelagibius marinus TaxID=2762760 RepID=UPI001872EC6F|nr:FAD:protein FMN transferase [Pelagibius marinus]